MKTMEISVNDHDNIYPCLAFVCPGCALDGNSGLHMLAVNTDKKEPAWNWNGHSDLPTLNPSILTRGANDSVCHSFLTDGIFGFLNDCTHEFAGKSVPMPDLPEWFHSERTTNGTD